MQAYYSGGKLLVTIAVLLVTANVVFASEENLEIEPQVEEIHKVGSPG